MATFLLRRTGGGSALRGGDTVRAVATTETTADLWATAASGSTSAGTNWSSTANATGVNNATFATWANTTSGAVGTLELTGYDGQTAIGAEPVSIDAVEATIYNYVTNTARVVAATAQLYTGTTALGAAVTLTRSTINTNNQTILFPVAPTWAQAADLRIRCVYTRAATTQAGSANVNAASLALTYTAAPPGPPPISERFAPDAILAQTGLTGAVGLIQDDPDSPDGNWLVA
jgi:asparagine N-glycosylation enzyme membrane subunit Stt3